MALHGKDLIILVDGVAIAAAKSCSIENRCSLKQVSSPSTGSWESFIAYRKGCSVKTSHLVLSPGSMLMQVGQTVTLSAKLRRESSAFMTGSAICEQASVSGSVGNMMQGAFSFRINGALTFT